MKMKKISRPSRAQTLTATSAIAAALATGVGGYAVGHYVGVGTSEPVVAEWPHLGMHDVLPPLDRYDLIQTNWPTISEGAVNVVANTMESLRILTPPAWIHPGGAEQLVVPTAMQVATDFVTAAKELLRPLHIDPSPMLTRGADANRLSALIGRDADRIQSAKDVIASLVEAGTIEADRVPGTTAREAVIAEYRGKIADTSAQLASELAEMGAKISTPPEGIRADGTGVNVFALPLQGSGEHPGGQYIRVTAEGLEVGHDGKVIGDVPLIGMPHVPPAQPYAPTR